MKTAPPYTVMRRHVQNTRLYLVSWAKLVDGKDLSRVESFTEYINGSQLTTKHPVSICCLWWTQETFVIALEKKGKIHEKGLYQTNLHISGLFCKEHLGTHRVNVTWFNIIRYESRRLKCPLLFTFILKMNIFILFLLTVIYYYWASHCKIYLFSYYNFIEFYWDKYSKGWQWKQMELWYMI